LGGGRAGEADRQQRRDGQTDQHGQHLPDHANSFREDEHSYDSLDHDLLSRSRGRGLRP
jgi:hypothetical protein